MIKHKSLIKYIFFTSFILLATSCTDNLIGDEGEFDEDIFLTYQTKTELELPFENETGTDWTINQGGRTGLENNHFSNREARYGVDFGLKINGVSFTGDGTNNEEYYSFGKRINAPGDGKIVSMRNTMKDNTGVGTGVGDFENPLGNYIVIDHLNGEFSFMAHFQENSIIVAVGDTVQKGQEVGKLGNSGRSNGPHLHYHMQTTSDYENGNGNGIGLPMQFLNYFADDEFIERGEPIKSQIVKKN